LNAPFKKIAGSTQAKFEVCQDLLKVSEVARLDGKGFAQLEELQRHRRVDKSGVSSEAENLSS